MYILSIFINLLNSRLAHKFEFILEIIDTFIIITIQLLVWFSLFSALDGKMILDYHFNDFVTYTMIARICGIFLSFKTSTQFAENVKEGNIILDLIRPISVRNILICNSLGNQLCNFIITGIPTLVVAIIMSSYISFPESKLYWLFFIISLILSVVICILLELLAGVLAFWKVPGDFVEWYFSVFFVLLSGAVVPLWLFPSWLLKIAQLLPFQAVYFIPTQIYMGQINTIEVLQAFGIQFMWVIILYIIYEILWKKGMHNLNIYGG